MAELVGQSILHALVASLIVEALLRTWGVESPRTRTHFRLLALAVPLAVTPALWLLAPGRRAPGFEEEYALFVSARWDAARVLGLSLRDLGVLAFSAAGVGLFLWDLVPFAVDRFSGRVLRAEPGAGPGPVGDRVAALARSMGIRAPRTVFLERALPVLACAGILRPVLLVSKGTLDLLDGEELEAALAHELAHVSHRDPLAGWVLMAVRTLLFFNPVVQVLSRALAHEAERRADDEAVASTRAPLALASGMLKLYRAHDVDRAHGGGTGGRASSLEWARSAAVVGRCRRLIDGRFGKKTSFEGVRWALAAASLVLVVSLVV